MLVVADGRLGNGEVIQTLNVAASQSDTVQFHVFYYSRS